MRAIALVLGLLVLGACSRAPGGGSAVMPTPELPGERARLVVLSPALAVILRDLGAGGLVVGRHNFGTVFEDLPACGQQGAIDYEQLLALRPTEVLIEWGSGPLPDRLLALADRNGWVVRRYELLALDDIVRATDELQRLYASDRTGEGLGAELERSLARRAGLDRVGRVLLLGATDPPAVLGPGSFHAQVLGRLGATPAVVEGGPWIELGLEDVVRLAPDAIVVVMPRRGGAGIGAVGADAVARLGSVSRVRVPAIERGRVAVLDGELYHTPSTAMADFARDLGEVLEGWAQER